MISKVNRIIIAGSNSGCGKTTITCAILKALKERGFNMGAFKCGPDYIDPMFHKSIMGIDSFNLDSFFMDDNTLKALLSKNGKEKDINIIEGVMGYYDGLGINTINCSTYDISKKINSPVILLINAKGASLSILATIKGFLTFYPDNMIKGVILNNCSESTYKVLKKEIEERLNIIPLGFMPNMKDVTLESRHLGLVTASEIDDLEEKLFKLGEAASKYIDLDNIIKLSEEASDMEYEEIDIKKYEDVKIGVALDKAFSFYYLDNLNLLKEMGANLIPFSPLKDKVLPKDLDGLYIGGGYPELYTQELSSNKSLLDDIKMRVSSGLPTIAECGGFMYLGKSILGQDMVNLYDYESYNTNKLKNFGYVTLTALEDSMLTKKGDTIKAHEFHYFDTTDNGKAFKAVKLSGKEWITGYVGNNIYSGFPHFNFYTDLKYVERFIESCIKEKHKND